MTKHLMQKLGILAVVFALAVVTAGCDLTNPGVQYASTPEYTLLKVEPPAVEKNGVYELKVGQTAYVEPFTYEPNAGSRTYHEILEVTYEVTDESGAISFSKYFDNGGYSKNGLNISALKPGIVTVVAKIKWRDNINQSISKDKPWFTAKAYIRIVDETNQPADNEDFSTEFYLDYSPKNPKAGETVKLEAVGLTPEQQAKGTWTLVYRRTKYWKTEEGYVIENGEMVSATTLVEDGFVRENINGANVTFVYGSQVKHIAIPPLWEEKTEETTTATTVPTTARTESQTETVLTKITPNPNTTRRVTANTKVVVDTKDVPKTISSATERTTTKATTAATTTKATTTATTTKPTTAATTTKATTAATTTKATTAATTTKPTSSFVPVTSITGVPSYLIEGKTIELSGTVNPANATRKQIEWSILSGETYISLTGNQLTGIQATATDNHPVLRARIKGGAKDGKDYVKDFQIAVNYNITVTPEGALQSATMGMPYSQEITTMHGGGEPYTFRVQSGSLPSGIALSKKDGSTAQLTGVPNSVGNSTFTIRVTDGDGNYEDFSYSIEVKNTIRMVKTKAAPVSAFVIAPPSLSRQEDLAKGDTTPVETTRPETTAKQTAIVTAGTTEVQRTTEKTTKTGTTTISTVTRQTAATVTRRATSTKATETGRQSSSSVSTDKEN